MDYDFSVNEVPPRPDVKYFGVAAQKIPDFGRSKTLKHLRQVIVPAILLVSLIAVAGCKKKQQLPPPAQSAPPAALPTPTAQLTATPAVISAGDQVQLSWRTTDATSVSIDGIGDVPTSGVKTVTPTASTSYHLVARGEGGSADATARVTVNAPPAVVVPTNTMSSE